MDAFHARSKLLNWHDDGAADIQLSLSLSLSLSSDNPYVHNLVQIYRMLCIFSRSLSRLSSFC